MGSSQVDIELLKLELPLLQQRIAQIENVQYRLRQFSLTLWVVLLSVGLGVPNKAGSQFFLLTIGILTPAMFMYLDAVYAQHAQHLRGRRDWVTEHVNASTDVKDPIQAATVSTPARIPRLDLTGKLTTWRDPQTHYRRTLVVKLTRKVRMGFYGSQMTLSTGTLGNELAHRGEDLRWGYYLLVMVVPAVFAGLLILRCYEKRRIKRTAPDGYGRPLNEQADGT